MRTIGTMPGLVPGGVTLATTNTGPGQVAMASIGQGAGPTATIAAGPLRDRRIRNPQVKVSQTSL